MTAQVVSSQASKIQRRLSPFLPISIRRFSQGDKTDMKKSEHGNLIDEERAHSTAEVFRKVAEERTGGGGVGGQAKKEESGPESTGTGKGSYKESPGNVNSG